MLWHELHNREHEPSEAQIEDFVKTPLWGELAEHMRRNHKAKPKLSYSNCAMDKGYWKGWNVKYQKSGKSLCTLYPKEGYFLALVTIGAKEIPEADLLMPLCDGYTQNLYGKSTSSTGGKSLGMEITNEEILRDVKNLVALRAGKKYRPGQG